MKTVVWTLPACVNCNKTKSWLDNEGIEYETRNLMSPEYVAQLQEFKDMGFMQAPIVEVSDGEEHTIWNGFNREKLEEVFQ